MKLFRDILKNPKTGRYSRKSVFSLAFFIVAVVLAFTGSAFYVEFLMGCVASLGLTVADKFRKPDEKQDIPYNPYPPSYGGVQPYQEGPKAPYQGGGTYPKGSAPSSSISPDEERYG